MPRSLGPALLAVLARVVAAIVLVVLGLVAFCGGPMLALVLALGLALNGGYALAAYARRPRRAAARRWEASTIRAI